MMLAKYGHSCIRIDYEGRALVIDPGELSAPEAVDGVEAILVTHEHPDHCDLGKIAAALSQRPDLVVYAHPTVTQRLANSGVTVESVMPGDSCTAAGLSVRVYGGLHAEIHPELPRVANLAFFIEEGGIYHPGDSFDIPEGVVVHTVFVPVAGTWLKMKDSIDFIRRIAPRRVYPIHDALLSEAGHAVVTANMSRLVGCSYKKDV